jgi:hypothetical protein
MTRISYGVPVPVRFTLSIPPLLASVMDSPALRAPVCAGVKFTPILQEAPAAKFDPQVMPSNPKSPVFDPVSSQLIGMDVLPVFCNTTFLVALVVPTF